MLKKLLLIIGGLLVTTIAVLAVIVITYSPDQRPAPDLKVEATPDRVARGKYLAENVLGCIECHTERDWKRYGGPLTGPLGAGGICLGKEHGFPGTLCAPNITPDEETGIGAWTDGEIVRAIREGVDRDGNAIFPLMPYNDYRKLSDEDVEAVVAYLRSLPAASKKVAETAIDFPVSFFIKMAPKPVEGKVVAPDPSDGLKYGEYLVGVAGCAHCHTPVDDQKNPIEDKAYAGGQEFVGDWGVVRSANITPHETGIGHLTRDSFIKYFKAFANPDSLPEVDAKDNTVMPWLSYAGMTEEDLGLVFDFLRTIPPQDNRVERKPQSAAALKDAGG